MMLPVSREIQQLIACTPLALALVLTLYVSSVFSDDSEGLLFQVDPNWPLPLPNGWWLSRVSGVDVDHDDNVSIVHGDPFGNIKSPPFDSQTGQLLRLWGGPGEIMIGHNLNTEFTLMIKVMFGLVAATHVLFTSKFRCATNTLLSTLLNNLSGLGFTQFQVMSRMIG